MYPRQGAPAYAVVMDDICKDDQPHEFAWQMMFADCMAPTLGDGRAVLEPLQVSGGAFVDSPADGVSAPSGRAGACRLKFVVKEAGECVLWGRVRTMAQEPGKSDSFFVAIDGGKPLAWHMPATRQWRWAQVTSGVKREPVTFRLIAGQHELAVQMREPGAQIDCLLFTRDRQTVPSLAVGAGEPLFLDAEAGQITAPMRRVPAPTAEPRFTVRIHADAQPRLSTDAFRPNDYHPPAAFPRLRATVRSVNPRFIAVLLPLPAAVKEPEVRFESKDGEADHDHPMADSPRHVCMVGERRRRQASGIAVASSAAGQPEQNRDEACGDLGFAGNWAHDEGLEGIEAPGHLSARSTLSPSRRAAILTLSPRPGHKE